MLKMPVHPFFIKKASPFYKKNTFNFVHEIKRTKFFRITASRLAITSIVNQPFNFVHEIKRTSFFRISASRLAITSRSRRFV